MNWTPLVTGAPLRDWLNGVRMLTQWANPCLRTVGSKFFQGWLPMPFYFLSDQHLLSRKNKNRHRANEWRLQ